MTPILCISKSDMPAMMYELGKASNTYLDAVFAVICFIIMVFFVIKTLFEYSNNKTFIYLFIALIFGSACGFFVKEQHSHNKQYQFSNFSYEQPAKFIQQYYTVTTGKEYKFIAETEHNVFIKDVK